MSNDGEAINTTCMHKKKKIGEGSYGVVYTGFFKDDKDKKLYAVKRNYKETTSSWLGNIHEADVLARLKGCQFIVNLHKMAIHDPFDESNPMTPNLSSKKDMSEDKLHFIMEYVSTSGDDYLRSEHFSYPNSRLILTQVLLGLHYMHKNKIIHRDLKPANILINFSNGVPYAKICDFGMSCNYNTCVPATPGVVTCWYRAPEICFGHKDYDYASDVWSFGCLVYEFFTQRAWLSGVGDENSKIFNSIVNKLEEAPSEEDLTYLKSKAYKKLTIKTNDILKGKRTSFGSQLKNRTNIIPEYESSMESSLDDLVDLLRQCLQINPTKRITLDGILRHKFFSVYGDYISSMLHTHLTHPFIDQVIINSCKERTWAAVELINIYNTEIARSWFSDIILFHGMDLFDRYIYWASSAENDKVELYDSENELHGKIHTKDETELRLWACIYVMHKYYCTLQHPKRWTDFFPQKFLGSRKQEFEQQAEAFEYCLIKNVCKYKVYRETLYEMFDKFEQKPKGNDIAKLLTYYCGTQNYLGTYEKLFQEAMYSK